MSSSSAAIVQIDRDSSLESSREVLPQKSTSRIARLAVSLMASMISDVGAQRIFRRPRCFLAVINRDRGIGDQAKSVRIFEPSGVFQLRLLRVLGGWPSGQ